ncbi:hypothetical protein [Paenibacillus maysiensis]|uniref:hypothetical protein n=1 Tax=Paenibacillus maysiensis TaxID=1155954 RepID=UPI001FD7DDD1|nr:hypothetical protein [Paenibacillus maysiensis]
MEGLILYYDTQDHLYLRVTNHEKKSFSQNIGCMMNFWRRIFAAIGKSNSLISCSPS